MKLVNSKQNHIHKFNVHSWIDEGSKTFGWVLLFTAVFFFVFATTTNLVKVLFKLTPNIRLSDTNNSHWNSSKNIRCFLWHIKVKLIWAVIVRQIIIICNTQWFIFLVFTCWNQSIIYLWYKHNVQHIEKNVSS